MSKIFLKINFKFYLMLQLTIKLMNTFSYSITTHFILSNKNYNFYYNSHSVYQTCPYKKEELMHMTDLIPQFIYFFIFTIK